MRVGVLRYTYLVVVIGTLLHDSLRRHVEQQRRRLLIYHIVARDDPSTHDPRNRKHFRAVVHTIVTRAGCVAQPAATTRSKFPKVNR